MKLRNSSDSRTLAEGTSFNDSDRRLKNTFYNWSTEKHFLQLINWHISAKQFRKIPWIIPKDYLLWKDCLRWWGGGGGRGVSIHCGWNIDIASSSKSAIVVGHILSVAHWVIVEQTQLLSVMFGYGGGGGGLSVRGGYLREHGTISPGGGDNPWMLRYLLVLSSVSAELCSSRML